MPFDGLRVLALESRRSAEIATLIRNQGGEPVVAESMRELPLQDNAGAFRFYEALAAGGFDMVILLTGVGARALDRVLAAKYGEGTLAEALKKTTVVARGPKPAAVLREWQVPITVMVPEPNTWREVLSAVQGRPERRIAVQEYGVSNERMLEALRARGAEVTPVRVYQWDLPENPEPLRSAVRRLAAGEIDVALFTTSAQVDHFFRIARELQVDQAAREALRRAVIGSIGPTTSETLNEFGVEPDLEPSHPRMGLLVKETADRAAAILSGKRP